ncbi:MAG: hypothetical protein QM504_09035 [Pseudomonadota bacterium]
MKIENENYVLEYDEENHRVQISGSLRLNGLGEYSPISNVLTQCLEKSNTMELVLSQLEFLNSSGIAMLSKFVIEARGKEGLNLSIIGSNQIPWQGKSLKNLQRLFPALEISIT